MNKYYLLANFGVDATKMIINTHTFNQLQSQNISIIIAKAVMEKLSIKS